MTLGLASHNSKGLLDSSVNKIAHYLELDSDGASHVEMMERWVVWVGEVSLNLQVLRKWNRSLS